jgi:hypothetical protein
LTNRKFLVVKFQQRYQNSHRIVAKALKQAFGSIRRCGTGVLGRQIARAYSKRRLDCGWRLENRHRQQLHGYSYPDLNYCDPRLCSLN